MAEAARGSKGASWWARYSDLVSPQFAKYLGYESAAVHLAAARGRSLLSDLGERPPDPGADRQSRLTTSCTSRLASTPSASSDSARRRDRGRGSDGQAVWGPARAVVSSGRQRPHAPDLHEPTPMALESRSGAD